MIKKRINQFVPSVHANDAVGSTSIILSDLFYQMGFESNIYGLYRDPILANKVKLFRNETAPIVNEDINILHFALPSPLTEFFHNCGGKRIIIYHNITPPHFFSGFQEELVDFTALGLKEIASLNTIKAHTVAYSAFSANDLKEIGFKDTKILPFLVNWKRYNCQTNIVLSRMLSDGWKNILFVGRPVPNKKQDDLIRLLAVFRKIFHKKTRLVLVGKGREGEKYLQEIIQLGKKLGNQPIMFCGRVSMSELVTCYRFSDVFVSMSEHEGFGVPLIESMFFDLPVVARASAAVPDTLGNSGILFKNRNFEEISYVLYKVLFEQGFRKQILASQHKRLKQFVSPIAIEHWKSFINSI